MSRHHWPAFLERITLMSDIDNRDESEDAVVLMTLHSAKGLEFPIVFIPGMENGIFPGTASFDEEGRLEEERRLCYVGITRAKKKLYLTGAETRMLYGRTDYTSESMFLDEMDKQYIDGETVKERQAKQGGIAGDGGLFGDYFYKGRSHGTEDGYSGPDGGNLLTVWDMRRSRLGRSSPTRAWRPAIKCATRNSEKEC